jgi:putative ABC transport system ATP-binding protein
VNLTLDGVAHDYGGPPILRGVNLAVDRGDTVAITGPSGSGKTSLLMILGFLTRPAAGVVRLDGRRVARPDMATTRAQFAWVFQTVNVLGRRTVLDNVALGLRCRGVPTPAATVAAQSALGRVGLARAAGRKVHTLSGGELQRVCIARAVAGSPPFLLADEPTGQLDRSTARKVQATLFEARSEGTALVIATHDHELAERCDRVYRLVDGVLVGGP